MKSLAVESARHGGLQSDDFCRIIGGGETFGQVAQFVGAQLPVPRQLECVLDNFGLLLGREAVHFFNEFRRGHLCHFTGGQGGFQAGLAAQVGRITRSRSARSAAAPARVIGAIR